MESKMNKITTSKQAITTFCVIALTLIAAIAAMSQAPARRVSAVAYDDIRARACSISDGSVGAVTVNTASNALLFNRTFRGQPVPNFCTPVLNPDGSQMTLGQFAAVSGQAGVKCVNKGTHAALSFTGLRPGGVYTVWNILFGPTPGPPIGVGGIGGANNSFIADENGEAEIGRTTVEGPLSFFGAAGPCLLDSGFVLEVLYHSDGNTYGPTPGPLNTIVANARFLYL
jgi:hypothetical protein